MQENDYHSLNKGAVTETIKCLQKGKDIMHKKHFDELHQKASYNLQRHLEQAKEPGASAWLTALPLKSLNYVLNKREFQDSVSLRYGWTIQDVPAYCGCGQKNDGYHSLDCKAGGYVNMRHNAVRDTFAYFLKEAKCKDVRVEPSLLPVNAAQFPNSTNVQDEARLDISAVGVYAPFERTFFLFTQLL